MSSDLRYFVIIVGCGRLGSYIANKLSHSGHSVVVIDSRESAFDALSSEYSGFRLEGDATEFDVLKQAKTDQADVLIATTHEDNVNVMVAQVAKKLFHVPRVMARVFDPKREKVYHHLGIETVSPTLIAGDVFLESIMTSPIIKREGIGL
jgi:trk system potassium uptake protein TrkA